MCKVQFTIDSPGEAKFRLTRSRRTRPFMSENKIPEQAAAQESRSQCRDAGRGFTDHKCWQTLQYFRVHAVISKSQDKCTLSEDTPACE